MVAIFWPPIEGGIPGVVRKKTKPAIPVTKATGMPMAMRTTNKPLISSMGWSSSTGGASLWEAARV